MSKERGCVEAQPQFICFEAGPSNHQDGRTEGISEAIGRRRQDAVKPRLGHACEWQGPEAGPSITACVMVKDGGELFKNMLWSIRDLVDEIVVINTDQKERTADTIAAEFFGARVFHSPWRKDFSFHRNQSISPATSDWLLIIDADEELVAPQGLRDWLAQVPEQFSAVKAVCHDVRDGRTVMRFPSPRLFRRGCVRYQGRVHNQPKLMQGKVLPQPGLLIRHFGYGLDQRAMSKKIARSRELLEAQLAEGDLGAHFYLAQQCGMAGDEEACLGHCEAYLAAREPLAGRFNPAVYYAATATALKLNRHELAFHWLKEGLAELPDDPDLAAALSDLGQASEDWELMEQGARLYLANREKALANPPRHFIYTLNPGNLAVCLHRLAMLHAWLARKSWLRFREVAPDLPDELRRVLAGSGRERLMAMGMEGLAHGAETKTDDAGGQRGITSGTAGFAKAGGPAQTSTEAAA